MRRKLVLALAIVSVAVPLGLRVLAPAHADDASDKSWFVSYVENTISTPDRKISMDGLDGALSSDVKIASITIADRQGVWLTIKDAHLVWSRTALLRGKLDIDSLEAGSIVVDRKPNPPEGVQPASSGGFSLPELPVSVRLGKLAVPVVKLSAALAGEETVFDVNGNALLEGGKLHAELLVKRTQPPGGDLTFTTDFDNASRQLSLNLSLQEPHGGFLTSMLKVPGNPPLGFTIAGSGPLDNFAADIALSADGAQLFGGKAILAQGPNGILFKSDLSGNLERLVDPAYADFVKGQSSVSIQGGQAAGGGYTLDHATIKSGVIDLSMSATLSPDAFPTNLKLDGKFGADDGHDILLPGGSASIRGMTLKASFGDGGWNANFDMQRLVAGTVTAESASITAGGDAQSLDDPLKRSLTFKVAGHGDKLTSTDSALAKALGKVLDLTAAGRWLAGQPVIVDGVHLSANAAQAGFSGKVDRGTLTGIYTLATPDISVFSGLAGRDLRGQTDLTAKGDIGLVGGALNLTFEGNATDVALGDPRADALLTGVTNLKGGLRRDEQGLHFDAVDLGNKQFNASATGLYGVKAMDFKASAGIADIKLISDRASGAVDLVATLKGSAEVPDVVADLTASKLVLQGKPFTDGKANFTGTIAGPAVNGNFSLSGMLDKMPIKAAAAIATAKDGTRQINGLRASAGAAQLAGDLELRPDNLASGKLTAAVPDMAAIAPLLLVNASGSLTADIGLTVDGNKQNAAVKAQAKALKIETNTVGAATVDLTGTDLRGVPALAGTVTASNVQAGSFVLNQLQASAKSEGANSTAFEVQGTMPKGKVALAGAVKPAGDGLDARLDTLSAQQQGISASLAAPVTIASRTSGVTIPKAVLKIGQGGIVSVEGTVAENLTMNVVVSQLPVLLANLFSPGLGASGTLSANAKVSGKPADPIAEFQVTGANLNANALKGMGLSALQLSTDGHYAHKTLTIEKASLTGAGGLTLSAHGQVPLAAAGLSVAVQGSAPLALANGLLRDREGRATGRLTLNANASGSISKPIVSGQAVIAGGTVTDPETGMKLTGISSTVRLDGDRATVAQFSATTQGGGSIGVSGSVSLKPDLTADLALTMRNAKLTDGDLATATVSSDITIRGPLMSRQVVAGRIDIQRAEITIPERFAANATMLGVKHLKPPPQVARTLAKAEAPAKAARKGSKGGSGPDVVLDLVIDAPARIFVRGRGIDAELGGQMSLKGPASHLSPVGSFDLRRGSLDVIGQHIVFDSGNVTLVGDLDPQIDFVATTKSSSISVTARVTGRASDPQIVLSSVPELPQDEVMAHFLFGRSIQDLSPLQIVQLATAVAQLAGGPSGPDLLGSIRKSTGLDNLGVVTDSSGNAAVQAGRYIGDNIYLGVISGVGGQTDATINLDVTKNLKVRGQAGTDGGKAGIYYEREY